LYCVQEFQDEEFTLPTAIGKFSKLERLALRSVDSAYLIEALASLKNARAFGSLEISESDIKEFPPIFNLTDLPWLSSLRQLTLKGCKELYSLPECIADMRDIQVISGLESCNVQYPPKSSQKTVKDIKNFFDDVRRGSVVWRRLKVVFLGNGRSGKTSLLRALAKLPFNGDEQSTRGVEVDSFAKNLQPNVFDKVLDDVDLDLSFWDFAGQLEYSASHDFFMSNRQALYVVVFSLTDDLETQEQQLLYWLTSVKRHSLQRLVRIMLVGTKMDLLVEICRTKAAEELRAHKQAVTDAAVSALSSTIFQASLQSIRDMASSVFKQVGVDDSVAFASRGSEYRQKGLSSVIASEECVFVTSKTDFRMQIESHVGEAARTLDFAQCRRALKVGIYSTCDHIFSSGGPDVLRSLKYPRHYREIEKRVAAFREAMKQLLPCVDLSDALAVKYLGKGDIRYADSGTVHALNVMHDLGIAVMYTVGQTLMICPDPQFLSSVISLLADPQSAIAANTTRERLIKEFVMQRAITRCNTEESARHLLQLLLSVRLVVQSGEDPSQLSIPLAQRGRPTTWKELHQLQDAYIIGRRLGSVVSRVSAATFLRLMTLKCQSRGHMLGCAFMYELDGGGRVLVRLLEDRSKVDVVVITPNADDVTKEVNQTCRVPIQRLTGRAGENNR